MVGPAHSRSQTRRHGSRELSEAHQRYAEHHERQTTMDFHHQLKGAILDAVDEGLIQRDPTRKAIIKGKPPCSKKTKYLNQFRASCGPCGSRTRQGTKLGLADTVGGENRVTVLGSFGTHTRRL